MRDSLKKLKTSYNWISFGYVVLGLVFLFWPELSLMTLCYAFGILTIVYGIVHLIGYFVRDRLISVFRYDLVIGIIAVALGIMMLIRPQYIVSILPILLGIFIILSSIMKIQNAIDLKRVDYPRWWLILVFALISIALGAILIWQPLRRSQHPDDVRGRQPVCRRHHEPLEHVLPHTQCPPGREKTERRGRTPEYGTGRRGSCGGYRFNRSMVGNNFDTSPFYDAWPNPQRRFGHVSSFQTPNFYIFSVCILFRRILAARCPFPGKRF